MKQVDVLETALDDIFADSPKLTGLVIDVRINSGGSDVFAISIASRLAPRVPGVLQGDSQRHSRCGPSHAASAPVMVHCHASPASVVPSSCSQAQIASAAAETFTMGLLDRLPHVTHLGANTQGVLSDVLGRRLPNGWTFGLPNEIYPTKDGRAFDGPGVPPSVEVPIFPAEDLANGRDSALDKAPEFLVGKAK